MTLGSFQPKRTLSYGNSLGLNPTELSTTIIYCVTSMIYFVYLTTWALRLDGYIQSSNSKEIRWISPKYISGLRSEI